MQSLLLLSTARSEYFINLMQHFFAKVFVLLNLLLFHAYFMYTHTHTHTFTGAPHNILSRVSYSLLFLLNSVTFRKLFPEYVEKYEQQQVSVRTVPEQVSTAPAQEENLRPLLDKHGNSIGGEVNNNRVEGRKDVKNQRRQSFPTWVVLLLVSIFGILMALPLLQL